MSDANLHNTTDASIWASEFCKRWPSALCQIPGKEGVQDGADFEATMTGWFANAIMTGVDSVTPAEPMTKNTPTGLSEAEVKVRLRRIDNPTSEQSLCASHDWLQSNAEHIARNLLDAWAELDAAYERGQDEAADKILAWLAKAVGGEDYTPCDGTETWDGDVHGSIYAILKAGNVYDDEDGRVAKLADAEAAVALAVERAVGIMQASAAVWRDDTMNPYFGENVADSLEDDIAAIRALAPASGLAAVQELRAERDDLSERLFNEGEAHVAARIERDTLAATLTQMQVAWGEDAVKVEELNAELAASRKREAVLSSLEGASDRVLRFITDPDWADQNSEVFRTTPWQRLYDEMRKYQDDCPALVRTYLEAFSCVDFREELRAALAQAPDGEGG